MIDQPTIDRILDAANIVDVVSEFVTLRKRGINYVGLCPFHTDKTPSFYVSPAKNICKCFACGEGGTAVHFIMKHEQLNYFDALRYLAKKYNIEIQERELTDKEKQRKSDRESMLIVNSWAQQYFTTQLYEHVEGKTIGLRYFAERGFREDTIRKFQLGYSLDKRDALYKEATKNGYKKEFLEKTGLVIAYDNGGVNDRFRGRVIFPVHTLSGKVVAFGGRVLKKDEKTAKYVNSPESEIYHKSNELYGIYFAKQAIVKEDRCFLVEGYTDVISMHQAGIENVVASSGTALTQGQIRLIHRFTSNITVLYDGDAAGIKAALRGIDLLLEDGMNVKVVLLPDGEDPDSFARKHNASQFSEFIKQSETDFIRFKTRLLLDDAGTDPIKRSSLITDIIRTVAIIPDNIARSIYIRECSAMMEIDEQVLLNEVNKIRLSKEERQNAQPQAAPPISNTASLIPEYPDLPGYQPLVETSFLPTDNPMPLPDDNMPPPPPPMEEYPMEETGPMDVPPPDYPPAEPPQTVQPVQPVQTFQPKRSPYEVYELTLLKYIVRYGEQILFDYVDEETNEHIVMRVAEYIRYDLERDDLTFYTPIIKSMLDEAADKCKTEGFIASRYFLAHPDPNVSRLAANLISEKYQLSKYHSKYRELEQEQDKLDQLVTREIYAMKDAYILRQIKETQLGIKEAHAQGNEDKVFELMKQLTRLNEIKNVLSKELGERIVLKM
ncbi:DNA primase [Parabacteroides sp. AM58-2XD]|uniref:DNA primase n=1 Tax=Parabacteroides TaxID=375288 RepID=UPI000FE23A45|nr:MULTISPECIES: DNA primase [Parabacteroides]MCM0718241.1 DNA primase [Parabacteroides sp. W1-Q-101]RGY94415.1 DNA primase [Parabacteroides sp. AM58-2XD]GKG71351.1 DNA primase [Parabacteroides goldsteinii]GKG77304.1 DNA primase [Parabacteroides goldsteinii]